MDSNREISETAQKSTKPEYTAMQLYRMAAVYDFLAKLIPTEGRDYSIDFSFSDGDEFGVKLIPHTRFGKIWCDYCTESLRKANSK